MPADAVECTY